MDNDQKTLHELNNAQYLHHCMQKLKALGFQVDDSISSLDHWYSVLRKRTGHKTFKADISKACELLMSKPPAYKKIGIDSLLAGISGAKKNRDSRVDAVKPSQANQDRYRKAGFKKVYHDLPPGAYSWQRATSAELEAVSKRAETDLLKTLEEIDNDIF